MVNGPANSLPYVREKVSCWQTLVVQGKHLSSISDHMFSDRGDSHYLAGSDGPCVRQLDGVRVQLTHHLERVTTIAVCGAK